MDIKKNKRIARKIEQHLCTEYGIPQKREKVDPIDVLIRTILSQNTTDINSGRAFDRLQERFGGWDSVRCASRREIERAIRSGGLAKTKAQRIKRILTQIHKRYGSVSLRSVCDMKPHEASVLLSEFNGVGPKTVNCVLLFGCGMNAFPVDTHILRISKRLGLVPRNATLELAHGLWAEFLPQGLAYSLHLNLIRHGRQVCHVRNPRCSLCCLRRYCTYPPDDAQ
jgi:endonuclease-3